MLKVVQPKSARGLNIGLLGKGPKWVIQCGSCKNFFKERLPMVNAPLVQCPYCKTFNKFEGLVVGPIGT